MLKNKGEASESHQKQFSDLQQVFLTFFSLCVRCLIRFCGLLVSQRITSTYLLNFLQNHQSYQKVKVVFLRLNLRFRPLDKSWRQLEKKCSIFRSLSCLFIHIFSVIILIVLAQTELSSLCAELTTAKTTLSSQAAGSYSLFD